MAGRTFVDSNILIYAHDADAGLKQRRAAEQLAELWTGGAGLLSTQVLQEFYVNVTRKIKKPLPGSAARESSATTRSGSSLPSRQQPWSERPRSAKSGRSRFGMR
jgi:predicted nucleic acid-binding protein